MGTLTPGTTGSSIAALSRGVDDRIRTGDRLDHNQELYRLSYVHRAASNLAGFGGGRGGQRLG